MDATGERVRAVQTVRAAQAATMHMVMPMRGLPRGRFLVLPAARRFPA